MFFRFLLILMIVPLFQSCGKKELTEEQVQLYISQSKQIGQAFSKELKSELKKAISTNGPAEAIGVCKNVSAEAEEKYTKQNPNIVELRRISHKPRNVEKHTPTKEEVVQLKTMQSMIEADNKPEPLNLRNEDTLTVLLPIVVDDATCLLCHGNKASILAPVEEAISKHYPNDQATGFEMGDLRGALAITWDID